MLALWLDLLALRICPSAFGVTSQPSARAMEAPSARMARVASWQARSVKKRLGADWTQWQWGKLHKAAFEHPLSARVDTETRRRLDVGTWPLGGSAWTPMATSYRASDYQLASGASFATTLGRDSAATSSASGSCT